MLFPVSEFGCHTQSESQIIVNKQGIEIMMKKKPKSCVTKGLYKMTECKHAGWNAEMH